MKCSLFPHRIARCAVLLLSAGLLPSCAVRLPTHMSDAAPAGKGAPELYKWWGDELAGPTAVAINLDEQKAVIYRGGQEAGWTMLASGTATHPTPTGTFSVMEKIQDKVSNTYGVIENSAGEVVNWDAQAGVTRVPPGCRFVGAQMPYWMRITGGGVGMHAGDIPNPGLPASHGCIRLPRDFAGTLYSVVNVGTRVTITGSGENAVARQRARQQTSQALVQARESDTLPSERFSVASLR